jgi:small GTP-binding protein
MFGNKGFNSDSVEKETQAKLDDIEKNLDKTVTVAIVGKVSAGKSSLLNALFHKRRDEQLATVGATSGVTTKVKRFKLSDKVEIMDSPGLGDIIDENSAATRTAMLDIDVGILVVTGSADVSQKQHYDELKDHCKQVFVVLNKIDEYDKKKAALKDVVAQWQDVLSLSNDEIIFQTCTDGYDPDYDPDMELDIRGVDELREAILTFLKKHGKDLLLAREMEKKSVIARRIIYGALAAVAVEAFIPGSALYITGTQAAAIMSIHYIYTGEGLTKQHAIAAIPLFASQSIGASAFLVAKSFLPPTGVLDIAAAVVAVTVTLAMLSTVNWMYENGYNFDNKTEIKEQFNKFKKLLEHIGAKDIITEIIKTRDMSAIKKIIEQLVK